MSIVSEIENYLRKKLETVSDACRRVRTRGDKEVIAQYEVLRDKLTQMIDILLNDAVAYYDNNFALVIYTGMTKDEILDKWYKLGKPQVKLSGNEVCEDLEKLLDYVPIKSRHLAAIKIWLEENNDRQTDIKSNINQRLL